MKPENTLNVVILIAACLLLVVTTGFNLPTQKQDDATPTVPPDTAVTPEPPSEIVHKDIPGSPIGKVNQTVHDQTDEKSAGTKQAFGGDEFYNGKYERPFDREMNYIPQVDLVTAQLNRQDPLWVYISYEVLKPFGENPEMKPNFLLELDTNLDNRGDVLITTGMPASTEWSTDSVVVLTDPDMNVGGVKPVKPDTNLSEGRGYYQEIFNNGKGEDADLAWSRVSKTKPNMVELAFKNTLTGGEKGKFIWLPWTDVDMLDWTVFDFNDHFTLEQAGYPLKEDVKNYPIKAIWGVDNTCRVPSGFTPTGSMPGLCPNYDPVASRPEKKCPPCGLAAACPPC